MTKKEKLRDDILTLVKMRNYCDSDIINNAAALAAYNCIFRIPSKIVIAARSGAGKSSAIHTVNKIIRDAGIEMSAGFISKKAVERCLSYQGLDRERFFSIDPMSDRELLWINKYKDWDQVKNIVILAATTDLTAKNFNGWQVFIEKDYHMTEVGEKGGEKLFNSIQSQIKSLAE